MLISLCTKEYDINGDILIEADESSDFNYLARRLTRTATLDGGAHFVDNGYSTADGTITINIIQNNLTAPIFAYFCNMLKNFGQYTISSRHGIFSAYMQNIINDGAGLTITLLIDEQLNA